MSSFRLSRRADLNLAEIYAFIARDNPAAAVRLIEQLFDLFHLLGKNPLMGQERDDLRPNLRCFTHDNYVAFYYPLHSGVEIAAVIHGARDVHAALAEPG